MNTLLDFSRIEAGRVRARFEPVDLCALTADLAEHVPVGDGEGRAGASASTATRSLEPVYVDREMWEKIVLNLLSNAFKFTLHRPRRRHELRPRDQRVVLSVHDTGDGIPEHELPRVFERFHRVEGTQGRSHEGSGIGLALVQELVKFHGGELTAASEVGRGSIFTVSIPLGSAHLPSNTSSPARPRAVPTSRRAYVEEALRWLPEAKTTQNTGGSSDPEEQDDDAAAAVGRVLLADDNADMREYARRLLGERWQVETVDNGRAALMATRMRPPDVIVTDVMMPELDGFGLLRELRADPRTAQYPGHHAVGARRRGSADRRPGGVS